MAIISKRVENTVGKGEIARYEQFFLFQRCFKWILHQTLFGKGLTPDRKSGT